MALLYVNEYARQARDAAGSLLPVGEAPAMAKYSIAIGGSSVQGPALNGGTTFIELHTDAICSIAIGKDAVATEDRMAANERTFRGVSRALVAAGAKVAVITNA